LRSLSGICCGQWACGYYTPLHVFVDSSSCRNSSQHWDVGIPAHIHRPVVSEKFPRKTSINTLPLFEDRSQECRVWLKLDAPWISSPFVQRSLEYSSKSKHTDHTFTLRETYYAYWWLDFVNERIEFSCVVSRTWHAYWTEETPPSNQWLVKISSFCKHWIHACDAFELVNYWMTDWTVM
jgi:hypothetical protein